MIYLFPIFAFLLGSIPFGLIISRSYGVDIRTKGSGNIGATNVLRSIGKKPGYLCLLLDFLKGFVPVLLAATLLRWPGASEPLMHIGFLDGLRSIFGETSQFKAQLFHVLTGFAAVMGHNYSPWVGFKGGKGIATSGGVLFALAPAAVVLLLILWILIFLITRYVSVASIVASAALPMVIHWGARFHHVDNDPELPTLWEAGVYNKPLFWFSIILGVLAIWKHRSNIVALKNGTENRFTRKKKEAA